MKDPFAARLAEMDKESAPAGDDPFAARLAEMDSQDKGPEARRIAGGGGMRRAVKSDEELGLDEGPKFSREFPQPLYKGKPILGGISGTVVSDPREAPGTVGYEARHSGDEMNDPGAQMLTGAALAAPVASLAPAALAPAVSGAQQSTMMGQDPRVGAALGLIPEAPALVGAGARAVRAGARAADAAIGDAAIRSAAQPPSEPGPIVKAIEHAAGAGVGGAIGHATGIPGAGYAGAAAGAAAAGAVRKGLADLSRKLTESLAGRRLGQIAATADADVVGDVAARYASRAAAPPAEPEFTMPDKLRLNPLPRVTPRAVPPPTTLAPLMHEGPKLPAKLPNGAMGTPFIDEISGEPVTVAGQGGFLPEEAPTNAGVAPVKPATLDQLRDLSKNAKGFAKKIYDDQIKALEGDALRGDVIRDAKTFRDQPYDIDEPPPADIGGQLDQSLQVLQLMKQAKEAGTLTPALIRSAVKLGMPAQAVLKIVGKEAFTAAIKPN